MSEQLGFISFVPWTLIFTIINTYILYRLIKRFLFKPVQKILEKRQEEVDELYQGAETLQLIATEQKEQYERQLIQAHQKAEKIIDDSVLEAKQEQKVLRQKAEQEAEQIICQARQEATCLEQSTLLECKDAIANMAVDIASKMTQQELNEQIHEKLIQQAILQLEEAKL